MPNAKPSRKSKSRGKKGLMYSKPHAGASPVPSHYVTTMSYFQTITMTEAAASTGAYYTFSLNNTFDPNFSGVGAQPVSFDQWSQMYSRYRVVKTDVQINFANASGESGICTYFLSPTGSMPASPDAWPSQRMGDFRLISPSTGGKPVATMKFTSLPWEGLSLTKAQYMDDMDYSHSSTAGPSRSLYVTVTCQGITGVLSTRMCIRLLYHVELSEPVNLTTS